MLNNERVYTQSKLFLEKFLNVYWLKVILLIIEDSTIRDYFYYEKSLTIKNQEFIANLSIHNLTNYAPRYRNDSLFLFQHERYVLLFNKLWIQCMSYYFISK